MPIDTDTLIALAGIMLAANAPFYYLSMRNENTLSWIRQNCPACIRRGEVNNGE